MRGILTWSHDQGEEFQPDPKNNERNFDLIPWPMRWILTWSLDQWDYFWPDSMTSREMESASLSGSREFPSSYGSSRLWGQQCLDFLMGIWQSGDGKKWKWQQFWIKIQMATVSEFNKIFELEIPDKKKIQIVTVSDFFKTKWCKVPDKMYKWRLLPNFKKYLL